MKYIPGIKLGILDFGYRDTTSPTDIIKDVVESACMADQLGYTSFWFGEHHNGCKAWNNPEMMVPIIAGLTQKINVGVAGILLAAYSPYSVALNFKLLSNIFPGRIDLGLANGVIKPHILSRMLCKEIDEISLKCLFSQKLEELLDYFYRTHEIYEREKISIPPIGGIAPNIWKLGISFEGLPHCISDKLNFCLSLFHSQRQNCYAEDKKLIECYRKKFHSIHGVPPTIRIAFAGICDKTVALARKSEAKLNVSNHPFMENSIVGDLGLFKEKLIELFESYSISEFVFYDKTGDSKKRHRTIEALAKTFLC